MMKTYAALILAVLLIACQGGNSTRVRIDPEEAEKDLAKLEEKADKNPDDPQALFRLAQAHEALGKDDQALEELSHVLRMQPSHVQALLLRANIFKKQGNTSEEYRTYAALLALPEGEPYTGRIAEVVGMPVHLEKLDVGGGNNVMAAFSADGANLAWQSDREGDWNILIANADGTSARAVTFSQGDDEFPAFLGTGDAIVFTSTRDELVPARPGDQNRELYHLNLRTKAATRLTHNKVDDWHPVGRPDGSLLFVSENGSDPDEKFDQRASNLYSLSLQDSTITALTRDAFDNTSPFVLADGSVAWVQIKDRQYTILIGTPGGAAKAVFTGPEPKSGLSGTPDAARLVFFMKKAANVDLYMLDMASGKVRRLTAHPADDLYPAMSPDGATVVFSSNRDGKYQLYRLDVNAPVSRKELQARLLELVDKHEAGTPKSEE